MGNSPRSKKNKEIFEIQSKNGVVNKTDNIIGIRIYEMNINPKFYFLENGHFFSFYDKDNFYIEISHSKTSRYIFKISSKNIYYYIQPGILNYYFNNSLIKVHTEENSNFEGNDSNYDLLEITTKNIHEKKKNSNSKINIS